MAGSPGELANGRQIEAATAIMALSGVNDPIYNGPRQPQSARAPNSAGQSLPHTTC